MKITVTLLILVHAALSAIAQTNEPPATNRVRVVAAPVNPGVVILERIAKERASIRAKESAASKKWEEAKTLLNLQYGAGKISGKHLSLQEDRLRAQFYKEIAPGGKRLGELELQEYETRKTYRMENLESKSAKQRGYGSR